MAYDYAGSFSQLTAHSANLFANPSAPNTTPYSTDNAIKGYISLNVNTSKIILGMPLFGHGFNKTDGFGKSFMQPGTGDENYGIWYYRSLPKAGTIVREDTNLGALYSYNPQTRDFVSYDTPNITALKTRYVIEKLLGGVMFWEFSQDKPGNESLMKASADVLLTQGLETSPNCITYPKSRFENLRNGTI